MWMTKCSFENCNKEYNCGGLLVYCRANYCKEHNKLMDDFDEWKYKNSKITYWPKKKCNEWAKENVRLSWNQKYVWKKKGKTWELYVYSPPSVSYYDDGSPGNPRPHYDQPCYYQGGEQLVQDKFYDEEFPTFEEYLKEKNETN